MCACSAANTIPLDDAYIYPDNTTPAVVSAPAAPATPAQATPAASATPTLEIVNEQDTTITVRIKR